MLLLNSPRAITVDGIMVFPDHADENQFWALPGPVQLAQRESDDRVQFTFIKYKPAAVESGVKGGGFLMFEVNLHLDTTTERRILSRLSGLAARPRLSVVQFDEGTVQCIALNVQGRGGTDATEVPGTFRAVEKILGATVPSLQGDNAAAFSLTLSQEGATILEQAFIQGTTPIGVIYDMKFTGIRPALEVEITADMERVYQQFRVGLEGQIYWLKVSIDAGFEKLVQEQVIKIKVTNFTTEGDRKQKEKWALDFFKDHLLSQWFTPTLTPGQLAGSGSNGDDTNDNGDESPSGGNTGNSPGSTDGENSEDDDSSADDNGDDGDNSDEGTQAEEQSGGASRDVVDSSQTGRQPARLSMNSSDPDPLPGGYSIEHTPAASGTQETITIRGGNPSAIPEVKVDGVVQSINSNRQVTLDVAANSSSTINVEFGEELTFAKLFFDFDEPVSNGWSSTQPPRGPYARYVNGQPTDPADDQFNDSKADFLDLLQQLVTPKRVELEGQASYEIRRRSTREETNYAAHNQRLSQRRLEVALGLVGNQAQVITQQATGHTNAQAAGTHNDLDYRSVLASGTTQHAVTMLATFSRPSDVVRPEPEPTPDPDPNEPESDPTPDPEEPDSDNNDNDNPPGNSNVALSFKLRFVHQEERRTIKFVYNSSDAIQRRYAPQGFFGLLLDQLEDKNSYFVEVDLDDPFFRVFTITMDAPIDFTQIGLKSAQLALDYGEPGDATNHKHGDFVFEPGNMEKKEFKVFMNQSHDTDYHYNLQYHFDPQSGWEGQHFSYDLPVRKTADRTLFINPYEDLGFLQINVLPGSIDWGVVRSIEVTLHYADPVSDFNKETMLFFTSETEAQQWKLRLSTPGERSYFYQFDYHLLDGTVRSSDEITTSAGAVVVDDPFDAALELTFIPSFNSATTRMVFVDVEYDDADNNYSRNERLRIEGTVTAETNLRFALLNPDLRTYRYRLTFIGVDNSIRRGSFIETNESIIALREEL